MNKSYKKAQEWYDSQLPEEPETWTCCGGIELLRDERCPVCGDRYEEDIYQEFWD